jgi:hypothetical protein
MTLHACYSYQYQSRLDKLKFKIKYYRISTKTEFEKSKLEDFRKKKFEHFWSKFAPTEFRFVEYHGVFLFVMTISCKTWVLFVAASFKIKNLSCIFWVLISLYVWKNNFFNFESRDEIRINEEIKLKNLNFILSTGRLRL